MIAQAADRNVKSQLLALVRLIPAGSVATVDLIAKQLAVAPAVIVALLANLTVDERDSAPWHRVVAKGGAIGRGPNRDQQFARLVREGVPVSPAGIVQDMAHVAVTKFDPHAAGAAKPLTAAALHQGRSRGMKDRPD